MINIFIILGLLLVIQIYIALLISDSINIDESRDNYYTLNLLKKFVEILVIMIIIVYTSYLYLRNTIAGNYIIQTIIVIEIFVVLFWLYLNLIEKEIIDYGPNDIPIKYKNNTPNTSNTSKTSNNNIFSKYIDKINSNFSFEYIYPNYNSSNSEEKTSTLKDYSAYNGYAKDDICYNCSCLKKSDGNIFCGKELPGLGIIGCSKNWKCHNCKKCQKWDGNNDNMTKMVSDNTSSKRYECKNCRCHKTDAGILCGKKTNLTGDIIKCNDMCERCSLCKKAPANSNSDNNSKYKTIYPDIPIDVDKIIINNISKVDIDNIL
jgi:hypothetical protein